MERAAVHGPYGLKFLRFNTLKYRLLQHVAAVVSRYSSVCYLHHPELFGMDKEVIFEEEHLDKK